MVSQKNELSELLVNPLLSEQLVNPRSQGQGLTRGCLLMAILKVRFFWDTLYIAKINDNASGLK